MPKQSFVNYTLAGALLLTTAPAAWAEVQAPTIWADWQDIYGRFGGALTAESEEYSDGTLTLSGVSFSTDVMGGSSEADYGDIIMAEQADGSVVIQVPNNMVIQSTSVTGDTTVNQSMTMDYANLSVVAREDDGVRTYDMSADTMAMEIVSAISAGDEKLPPTAATLSMTGLASVYRSGLGGDETAFEQDLTADEVEFGSSFVSPDGGNLTMSYVATGVDSDISGSFGEAPSGPVTSLSDMGITYVGKMTHGGSTMSVLGTTPEGPLDISGTSESAELTIGFAETALRYALASRGGAMAVQVPAFPLPINLSMTELGGDFTVPMGDPGEEQPFALSLALRDLVVDDVIWGLFDPTAQLPRDPATIVVEMDGTAVMNVDMFGNPEAMAKLQGPPGELQTLAIDQILVSLAGAELRGVGNLDFPVSGPVPQPVGTIELALDGGFGLLDSLTALGFIPAEWGGMARGMAGMVARPVGDDQLESTIEFTPGGGISANGMPLK